MENIVLELKDEQGEVYKTLRVPLNSIRLKTAKRLHTHIDVANLIKECKSFDELTSRLVLKMMTSYNILMDIIFEIFPDVTQDELEDNANPEDIAAVFVQLIMYTVSKLADVGADLKNLLCLEAERATLQATKN